MINKSYFFEIRKVRENKYKLPWGARFGFMAKIHGNGILRSVSPNEGKKFRTYSVWEPTKTKVSRNIFEKFDKSQQELMRMIEDCQDLVSARTVMCSPAAKNVFYTIDKAFEIILTHQMRHFEHAIKINNDLEGRARQHGTYH